MASGVLPHHPYCPSLSSPSPGPSSLFLFAGSLQAPFTSPRVSLHLPVSCSQSSTHSPQPRLLQGLPSQPMSISLLHALQGTFPIFSWLSHLCLPLFSLPDSWPRSPWLSFSPLDVPPPPCQASPHPYPDYRRNSKHPYLWQPIHPHSAHSHRLWAVASSQPLASLPIFPLWDSASLWVILTPPSPWPHPLLDSLP